MTWKLARNGVFNRKNEARFRAILHGEPALVGLVDGRLTIGDKHGPLRWLYVLTPDNKLAEPTPDADRMLRDPECTKVSARLSFPPGVSFYRLYAQVDEKTMDHIGYIAPKEAWLSAEMDAAADKPEFLERVVERERRRYFEECGFLPPHKSVGKKKRLR